MWDRDENRLAVLELLHTGQLKRRESQREAWEWLSELPWTKSTGRRDEVALPTSMRSEVEDMLDRRWPEWRNAQARLVEAGLPATYEGWKKLRDMERADRVGALPPRLNARTAAAYVGPHSKAGLTDARRASLDGIEITRDGIVRLRPNKGLVLEGSARRVDASIFVAIAGEVVLNERALRDGTRLAGMRPSAALLVENLGPYIDVPVPEDWMVIHVPGWNTTTARQVLDQLEDIPILHFGDLDPQGAEIVNHLRKHFPRLQWVVPEFWKECVPERALKRPWPSDLDLSTAPPLVRELRDSGLWLEQETITLDPRLPAALVQAADRSEHQAEQCVRGDASHHAKARPRGTAVRH